jgi:formylglycine-generating enzyme required for sulfatase activity
VSTSITDNTATSIKAAVPIGATTGNISVTTAGGTATSGSNIFTVTEKTNLTDGATMVWVPGGTFTMGSQNGVGNSNEQPAHLVTLSGYWIYKYDVTVAQYRAFCAATSRSMPPFPSDYSWADKSGWDDSIIQQHPIVNVTWYDCKAYADWYGVKLPTEAQWEYASRGPQGNNYPWGGTATANDFNNGWDQTKCANFFNSYSVGKSTWPVGSFPAGASWCGAQDMAGNVWQWCTDWSGDYSSTPVANPTGPTSGYLRVLRGGSWYYYYIRGAYRNFYYPDNYLSDCGFRCASSGQ